jgi:myosin heavy subunit
MTAITTTIIVGRNARNCGQNTKTKQIKGDNKMIKTSEQIEPELDETTARLDELCEMRRSIESNLKTLQSGFIKRQKTLDELQAEQSKLTILNDSIKSLEATQTELHDAYQRASLIESRAERLEKAKTIAGEAADAHAEYINLRFELDESIRLTGGKMVDVVSQFFDKQYELKNALTTTEPQISYPELELPKETTDLVSGVARNIPALEFGDAVQLAENRIADERRDGARIREGEQTAKVAAAI